MADKKKLSCFPELLQPYVDIVEQEIVPVCKEQKQLIEHIKNVFAVEDIIFDATQAEKYLSYQKYFPYDLFPWEIFCFVLHNCTYKKNGSPRWKDLFILVGRGAGKNGYLAFEDFCLLTDANDIPYYDIDICATNEDQAKTSFDDIYNVLENPKHRKKLEKHFYWNKTEIVNKKTKSKLKYRTNNAKGKDGLRSGKVDFDEVHAYENWDNLNVFTTGLGKKQHPRRTYVTTNGDVRGAVLDSLIEKAEKILSGELPDNGFLPFICKLDDEKEVHDEANWHKANPSLQYLPTLLEEIQGEYLDFKLDPNINSAFMTKRMNMPQGRKDTEVTSWENILATNGELPDLEGCSCVLGIDFAKTTDFVSAFLLFKDDGHYYGIHHSWFCNKSNDKHRIKIPLDQMAQRGLLTIVEDVEINPTLIADWISQMKETYHIEKIAIDSYRYSLLSKALREIGYDANDKMVKLVRPSDIMLAQPKINSIFLNHKLTVGDDPLFRWGVNNAKLEPAQNNNFKYGKIEPKSRKTDMFMAFVAAMTLEEELPETHDVALLEPIFF